MINFTSTQDIIILTITDNNFPQSIAFSSMENVNEKVWKYFGAVVHSTVAMGLDLQLSAALSNEMKRANNPDNLAEVQEQVDDLKKIMIENIEAIMTRGELLEILMIDINELIEEAEDFRRNAQEIQAAMRYVQYLYLFIHLLSIKNIPTIICIFRWKNMRMKVIFGIVAAIFISIIIIFFIKEL